MEDLNFYCDVHKFKAENHISRDAVRQAAVVIAREYINSKKLSLKDDGMTSHIAAVLEHGMLHNYVDLTGILISPGDGDVTTSVFDLIFNEVEDGLKLLYERYRKNLQGKHMERQSSSKRLVTAVKRHSKGLSASVIKKVSPTSSSIYIKLNPTCRHSVELASLNQLTTSSRANLSYLFTMTLCQTNFWVF